MTETCPHSAKVCYPTEREAKKALTRLIRVRAVQGSDTFEVSAYKCPKDRRHWHLTSLDQPR